MCKKAVFYNVIFVKKQYFYNRSICKKKPAFLHKNDAFLQGAFFNAI